MIVISRYPSGRDSWTTLEILDQYLQFVLNLNDHSRLVFVDENLTKEVDVYRLVKRDPINGDILNHPVESVNSKNRYSILGAVNIKGGNIPPLQFAPIEEYTDSSISLRFI